MLVFAAIGLAAGILLTVCSKIFEVKVDERVEAISEALPQVNCGACGFKSCKERAVAIARGLNMPENCHQYTTAKMEEEFDQIAEGKMQWKNVIGDFYGPFEVVVEKVEKELEHVKLEDEASDVPCDKCGRMMVYKFGRYGKFLACPGYPECKNAKPIVETIDTPCPKCGGVVQVRKTKRKRPVRLRKCRTGLHRPPLY